MSYLSGVLNLKVLSAKLTHDTELFGSMDPFVLVTIGGVKERTKTHIGGGKNPKWGEVLKFKITNENDIMIACYDEESVKKDDLIGNAKMNLEEIKMKGVFKD